MCEKETQAWNQCDEGLWSEVLGIKNLENGKDHPEEHTLYQLGLVFRESCIPVHHHNGNEKEGKR